MIFLNEPGGGVDSRRLALEASSAGWFRLVKYAGYAVAFGCALEAPETLVIIKRWWVLRFRDDDEEETKEDRKKWYAPAAAAGLLIIVIGILVETFAEGKVSDVDALLRSHESEVVTAAENKAETAENDAGMAVTKAAILDNETQSLKTDAANAKRDMVKSQLELAKLTGPLYPVRVIDGAATPDLSKSLTQLVVLRTDGIRIKAPILPPLQRGGIVKWTLLLDEDEIGAHPYTLELKGDTTPMPGLVPNSRTPMDFETDATGHTILRGVPIVNMPAASLK